MMRERELRLLLKWLGIVLVVVLLAILLRTNTSTAGMPDLDLLPSDDGRAQLTDITVRGTALERVCYFDLPCYWRVLVSQVLSGPSISGEVPVFVQTLTPPCLGYEDPQINAGDAVEVRGLFQDGPTVSICESNTYYIVRFAGQEVKFRGRALSRECGITCWWMVDVEEVILGPSITGPVAVHPMSDYKPCYGFEDPNVDVDDQVEVYGIYYSDGSQYVDLCDSTAYYIAEISDTSPPSIGNIRESDDPINKQDCPEPTSVTIRAYVTDDSSLTWVRLYYRPPGGSWTYATMSHESGDTYVATIGPFSQAGTLDYYVKARDNAGNEARSSTRRVTINDCDTTPPSISNIRESNDPINKQGCPSPNTVIIRADVTDDRGLAWVRLYYQPPGGSWTYATMSLESGNTYAATIGPFSQAGTLDYYVKARDNAGNEAHSGTRTVTINDCDTSPPSISNIRESADPINKQGCPSPTTVTIRADVTDDRGLAWVRLYYQPPGGSWTYATMSLESGNSYAATIGPFSQAGTLDYYVKARDSAGNEAQSSTYTVTVNDCQQCATHNFRGEIVQYTDDLGPIEYGFIIRVTEVLAEAPDFDINIGDEVVVWAERAAMAPDLPFFPVGETVEVLGHFSMVPCVPHNPACDAIGIRAEVACDEYLRIPTCTEQGDLTIEEIEVNQAIQKGVDPSDPAFAHLVADKPTVIRVYLNTGGASEIRQVTGRLTISGYGGFRPDPTLITAKAEKSPTLNFYVLDGFSAGRYSFEVQVSSPCDLYPNGGNSRSVVHGFDRQRSLTIAYVPIEVLGKRPDLYRTARAPLFMRKIYPISTFSGVRYYPGPEVQLLFPVNVVKVLKELDRLRYLWGPDYRPDYVVGFLPEGMLLLGAGVTYGSIPAALVEDASRDIEVQVRLAHEVGHLLGLDHAEREIGRGGFDVLEARALPEWAKDFMGAKGGLWIGIENWRYLHNQLELVAGPELATTTSEQQYLLASGLIYKDQTVELDSFLVITSSLPPQAPPGGPYSLKLIDSENRVLATHHFDVTFRIPDPGLELDAAPFSLMVPFPPNISAIVIEHEGYEFERVIVSSYRPVVRVVSPNGGEAWDGIRTVTWTASDADGDSLTYSLLYSPDGGQSWVPIATDLAQTSYQLDTTKISGSTNARIRVLATDGVNTAQDESDRSFRVAAKPPMALIAVPRNHATLDPSTSTVLVGEGYDLEDGSLADDNLSWYSDRDGFLGTGHIVQVPSLSLGFHRITLEARDSNGNVGTDSITLFRGYRTYLPLILNNHAAAPQPPITPTPTNTPTPVISPTATPIPTPTPTALLLNPGFEQGLLGWNSTGGTASYTIDSTTSVGGSYSVKGTEQNEGNLGRLYQDVTGRLDVGGRYKISGWIKTQNITGRVVIGLDYVASNGWTPGDGFVKEIGFVTGTTDWTYYESSPFTLPPMPRDATRLWFLFDFNAGSGTAWWDEVALVPVEEPTSTEARVLFDEAHGEGTSILTNYRELADNLRSNGYSIDRVTTRPITYDSLKDYEVFVVGNASTAFDAAEVNAIVRFVQEGGGLFLAAQAWWWASSGEDHTLDNFPPNVIGSNFGIRFLEDAIYDPSSYYPGCTCTPVFYPAIGHQILSGVSSFGGPVVSSPITTTSTTSFPILYGSASSYSNGGNFAVGTFPPTVVAALHGSGRVAALGHEGYLSTDDYDGNGVPNLYDNDNLRLGLNIIDWLAKRSSQLLPWLETYFDDGSAEFGFVAWPGGLGAVRFTVPSGARIERLRFYVWGDMDPVNVHILDRAWTPLLTRAVTPSPGWFEVDVSDANVVTDGEFYVAWQWLQEASGGPWLGFDNTPPHYHQSYLGNLDPTNPPHVVPNDNYFIRAVVSYPADIPAATPTPTPTLIPGLSPEDRRELTACLQTLSSGWVQSAVDRCNAILTRPEYDAARQLVSLLGRYGPAYPTGSQLDDTWEYDGSTWVQVFPQDSPAAREQHAMAYDAARRRVVMFGGFRSPGGIGGNTWAYYALSLPLQVAR